jgi:hypothetical protein
MKPFTAARVGEGGRGEFALPCVPPSASGATRRSEVAALMPHASARGANNHASLLVMRASGEESGATRARSGCWRPPQAVPRRPVGQCTSQCTCRTRVGRPVCLWRIVAHRRSRFLGKTAGREIAWAKSGPPRADDDRSGSRVSLDSAPLSRVIPLRAGRGLLLQTRLESAPFGRASWITQCL